jgi:glucose/arabinose dehydrogenase
MVLPMVFWVPSITTSGLTFYKGDKLAAWKGNLFVGSMTVGRIGGTGHLQRVVFNDKGEQRRESLLVDLISASATCAKARTVCFICSRTKMPAHF